MLMKDSSKVSLNVIWRGGRSLKFNEKFKANDVRWWWWWNNKNLLQQNIYRFGKKISWILKTLLFFFCSLRASIIDELSRAQRERTRKLFLGSAVGHNKWHIIKSPTIGCYFYIFHEFLFSFWQNFEDWKFISLMLPQEHSEIVF